jgi:hypothetical protein
MTLKNKLPALPQQCSTPSSEVLQAAPYTLLPCLLNVPHSVAHNVIQRLHRALPHPLQAPRLLSHTDPPTQKLWRLTSASASQLAQSRSMR